MRFGTALLCIELPQNLKKSAASYVLRIMHCCSCCLSAALHWAKGNVPIPLMVSNSTPVPSAKRFPDGNI
jgi:hypothetical protein